VVKRRPRTLSVEEAAEALQAAEATLSRWSDEAADKERQAEVLAAELAEAQARAADDLLDDDDPDVLSRVAADLERRRTEQALAVQAAERAAERVVAARRDVLRARAATVRTRAEGLKSGAAARQARTDQMLAELAEFERVTFGVADQNSSGVGTPFRPWTSTRQLRNRAQWLADHADHLDVTAESGTADLVMSLANQPIPPVLEVEAIAIGRETHAVASLS
jgi:hypothetical protein